MLGLVGCGFWGPNFARIASQESMKLKWCVDLDKRQLEKMKAKYPGVKTTSDFREMLADDEVKAAIIATPANSHFEIARSALEAGKHVLVEKPIATKSSECEALIELAAKREKVLMVGHTFLYHPAVDKLRDYIKDGKLGEIYYIYSTRVNLGQIRGDVNCMWNLAPHDISIANYLIGTKPKRVRAYGKSYIQDGIEDVAFLTLEYPGNVMAHIHVSWLDPAKVRKLVVVGSRKMAVFDDIADEKVIILDKGAEREKIDTRFEGSKPRVNLRYGEVEILRIENSEPLKNEFVHFLDCIGKNRKPLTDGRAGLEVVRILEAAQNSLGIGGEGVDLND